jgi:hypothetical protein
MGDDSTRPSEPADGLVGSGATGATAGWEFLEVLAVVILAAQSLRIVGSVVSGLINGLSTHLGVYRTQQLVGSAMERAANFADGPGIVLLLVSLALLWWRAEYWSTRVARSTAPGVHDGALGAEVTQALRLGAVSQWARALFLLAALGAAAFLAGDILVNTAGGVSRANQWQAYANDSFSAAYLVIGAAGVVASTKLIALCHRDVGRIETAA